MLLEDLLAVEKRFPDSFAVVTEDRKTTYTQLMDTARRMAGKMKLSGVERGDRITIEIERSELYIAAMIGAFMLGASFVALDSAYPKDRLDFIARDCGARVRVDTGFVSDMDAVTPLDTYAFPAPDDEAFLVYTSGSTGRPKGVIHTHRVFYDSCLRHQIMMQVDRFKAPGTVIGEPVPFSFIAGLMFVFGALTSACILCIIPSMALRDSFLLSRFVDEYGINVCYMPPKTLKLFTQKGNCLKLVLTGSERVTDLYKPGLDVINVYGSSETVGATLTFHIDKNYDNTPVGKPIGNLRVYILGDDGTEADEGEICISGSISSGYLNLPEQTEKAFVPNPFREQDGFPVLYKTGDLARRLPDGNLQFVNRKDWMIKINGQRVEPGEIEAAIRSVKGIQQVAVKDFIGAAGQTYICSYYVTEPGSQPESSEIRKVLTDKLPSYMVPAYYVRMDRLPVNANGKLDRKALQAPEITISDNYVAPRNETETVLCEAFAKVLNIPKIGIKDDFFALGGDSIRVMVLQQACPQFALSTRLIYEARTVEQIAGRVSAAGSDVTSSGTDQTGPTALSQAQLGIFLSCEERVGEIAYNNPILFSLSRDTDEVRLKQAIETAVRNHPGLLVRISLDETGMPVMQYEPSFEADICTVIRIGNIEEVKDSLIRPFLLRKDRLFRFEIYKSVDRTYLFMDIHHVVFDGASFQVLLPEIMETYHGKSFPAEDYTAFHVARDEAAERSGEAYEAAREWYLKEFADVDEITLPEGDGKRGQTEFKESRYTLRVDLAALQDFCYDHNTTLNVLTTGAFGYLLSLYTMNKKAAFATVYNGRHGLRTARTVTMLVKTLPVLCTVDPDLTVSGYLDKLKTQMMGTMVNDLYSFRELSSRTGYNSDVLFTYQGNLKDIPAFGDLDVRLEDLPFNATGEKLSIQLFSTGKELMLDIQYHGNLYSEQWVRDFSERYEKVVRGFLSEPNLKDITLVGPGETKRVLDLSYGGSLPYDESRTYVKMLTEQASLHPDKRAVFDTFGSYTFRQLDELSNAIAHDLAGKGIGSRDFVALKMGRVKEFVAAIAGVQKAGAAYIPVDPTYPEERIAYMIEDSGARTVLTEESVKEILSGTTDVSPIDRSVPGDPAYMIYTSGSTGKPKGVVILNRSLTAGLAWRFREYGITENDRNVCHPSFSFDASVDDLFAPLAAGGELHILSEQQRKDLDLIYDYLNEHRITGMTASTQIGMSLINAHPDLGLRYMVLGGEKLLPFAKTNIRVFNGYGPTEFTVCSSFHEVDQEKDTDIPIGRAVPNSYSFICDQNGNLLPQGMVGELCLSGVQISEGYFGRPELNRERFVDCKFLPGEKMFRTGDLARYNADGEMEYCGRIDFQVKLRGFRIELGEIENCAAQFQGVEKTIVLVKDKRLVLYYTADDSVREEDLLAHMAAGLAEYMVPSVLIRLDVMPLNPNGKIDRKALPEPERRTQDTVQPETEDENALFDLLSGILGYEDFGVTDDFKDAGLTSLSAMQFAAGVSARLGKPVRMGDLVDHPCIRDLARFVHEKAEEKTYEKRNEYPLTKLQEGIFVECTTHPGSTIYNIPLILKLDPGTDTDRLEQSLTTVIDVHPYLKMRLRPNPSGDVVASRDDTRKIRIARYDLSELNGGLQGFVRPFDLQNDDLFRAALVRDGSVSYLCLDAHHIVFDGESLTVFMRELDRAYRGEPVPTERYTGFEAALEEEERVRSEAYAKARSYYEALIGDTDTECIPIRDRDEGEDRAKTCSVDVTADPKTLSAFLSGSDATVNALWNAAFGFVLAKFLARDDSVFTTVYNGRGDSRLQNAVGMYVHTLPVVYRAQAGEEGRATVKRIAAQLTDSMSNDLYPFSEISRNLGVKANVMFVYEGRIGTGMTLGGKPVEPVPVSIGVPKEDLTVYVFETDEGFRITCEYNARFYEEWSILSFAHSLASAFGALMNGEKAGDIALLSPEAARRMEDEAFQGHETEDTDIATLFSRTAGLYADRVAVIFRDRKITYRELDDLSDRIAAYLQKHGVGREDIVSVLVPRGEFMPIAALGVLKAGAAYEPLDPSYPPERLNFMVKNARARLVIADEGLTGLLSDYSGEFLLTRDIPALPAERPSDPGISGSSLFIVLYTSGTTGTPKGVMLEHRNLVNFCTWYRANYDLKPESVVGAYASFGFDADMMDLYPALTTGAAVYIIPEDMRLDLSTIDKALEEHKVSHLFMTTQMGRMFAENMTGRSLSHLSVGGETLTPLTPPETYTLWNGYGPTECTIFTTACRIGRKYYRNPIGQALWNYRLYVVDKAGKRLPAGALGELWIAGAGVGRGYLDLPEKTKEAFIQNPFDSTAGFERVYRTGDTVRRLGDGSIDFIGRSDGQVKVRGFRIELGEVESVIREYPGIRDVTIQAYDDTAFGGKFIAAYVVSDGRVDFRALAEFIKEKKPPYMVPASFMQLDAIPLNQNQKVNRRALPAPVRQTRSSGTDDPETDLERDLCSIFAGILGVERVGATDHFFELGGTSISAAKVVMFAMNKNYPIAYKDVFDHPTARELAKYISQQNGNREQQPENAEDTREEALRFNTSRYVEEISGSRPLGRTLLTGATGFLGSHILRELLRNGVDTLVLSRGTDELDARTRLSAMMMYYFDEPLDETSEERLRVIDGDITDDDLLNLLKDEQIDTILNSAACVKHFAADDRIERINVGGVKNLIEVARSHSARLVQISTLSVAGENIDGKFPPSFRLGEDQLFVGQDLSNKYVNSKFKAEEAVLGAAGDGLDVKIIRVGNLMGRQSDGEFQINSITNSFVKSLRAYAALGYFPVSACDSTTDFSPVDEVARAVVLLAQTDREFTVFHAANAHEVQMGDVIEAMNENGFDIRIVSDPEFAEKLGAFMKAGEKSLLVSSLLTYASSDHHVHTFLKTDNTFTVKALYRLGFKWPITDAQYLHRIIEGLNSLRFFERDDM